MTEIALALASAGLLTGSLPAPDIGWLAWIALVPLIFACERIGPPGAAAVGFLFGMAANFGIYRWLFAVNGFGVQHFLILSTFFALYPAAWCAGVALFKQRRLSLIFTAPALWTALDYVRAHAGFMAFPWGTLAHTQHQNLAVLQIATITGEYGVTFLVVMANAAMAEILLNVLSRSSVKNIEASLPLSHRGKESLSVRVVVAGIIIAVAHAWGAYVLYSERPGTTIRVAAIQPSILLHDRDTAAGRAVVLNRLDRLTRAAAASHPDFIAWPETAVAGNLRANPFLAVGLLALAREIKTPIVLGIGEVEKFAVRDAQGNMRRRAYNAAYFVAPMELNREPYIKRVLLPFGEYVPLENVIGWPAWLAPPVFNTVVGHKASFFTLPDGTVFSPLICWENLFATLARESVQGGARLLVLLTNDGWFGRTAEARQHNLASVLRAVENRVPIVVSSNTGPSQVIDPNGRIVARAPLIFTEDSVTGEVKLGSDGTLYTRIGDIFVFIVIGGLACAVTCRLLTERFNLLQQLNSRAKEKVSDF